MVWSINDANDNFIWPIEFVLLECLVNHCFHIHYQIQLCTPIMKHPMCFTLYINVMTCEMCDNRKLLLFATDLYHCDWLGDILLLLFLIQMTQLIAHLS